MIRCLPSPIRSANAPRLLLTCLPLAMLIGTVAADASGPRALPEGSLPQDVRLGPLKDLNGYFPFIVPESREAWKRRREQLQRQVLVSQGLWPMPTRQPLEPVLHGPIEQDGYTVEKVYFQSMPGFYVTGNLYRPSGSHTEKLPGVLCPHGHWANGRFYDCGEKAIRRQIVQGAERFLDGGRSPMQSRCVQLARMGCVVFHYDMIGYADSQQIGSDVIHRFREQRPEMNDATEWGLYSPQAESRLQSSMGLQTYNSIRSLDFLLGLPNVDPARIAVTGASGGGTQTFMLAAIDPRVTVAFPAVMVSTAMQGGCTCENACCLRVGTGNIELAALFAPRPQGLTAADDWTVEMATKGFPELKQLYEMLGAAEHVSLASLTHFGHNYNYVSRAAMYSWLNRHLELGGEDPIVEPAYERLSKEELTVWNDAHPRPPGGPDFERQLLAWWDRDAQQQLDALLPTKNSELKAYQDAIAQGIHAIIARPIPDPQQVQFQPTSERAGDGHREVVGLLTYELPPAQAVAANPEGRAEGVQEQLPVVRLRPDQPSGRTCLLALPGGKRELYGSDGQLLAPIVRLLKAGVEVCAADLLFQGEFLEQPGPISKTRRVENPREAAAYTFGYNPTLLAHRSRDLLSLLALLRRAGSRQPQRELQIDLVGLGTMGPVAAVAAGQAPQQIQRLAIDNADFRFASVDDLLHPMFLPGGAKYHDLPGILALFAPRPLWLASENSQLPRALAAAYQAAGQAANVTWQDGSEGERLGAIVDWLLR